MYILGIETSCDETSAAVIDHKFNIISNIIFSQQRIHSKYFGVVPELASRTHYEKIHFVISRALQNFNIKKIDLIAYTETPGLKGALLIGKTVAHTLGYIYSIPVIGVDHLWGHIHSLIVTHKNKLQFPFISLIISGGHTELSIVYSAVKRKVLGETRDDAVGEAFDKVAKMLNLSYPGGPVIEKYAKKGNPKFVEFSRPYMEGTWDFSFSGLKTAVLYYLQKNKNMLNKKIVSHICASFQESVVDTLMYKVFLAAKKFKCSNIGISGGVAANEYLREKFSLNAHQHNIKVFFPQKILSTDNAVMIACAGYFFSKK